MGIQENTEILDDHKVPSGDSVSVRITAGGDLYDPESIEYWGPVRNGFMERANQMDDSREPMMFTQPINFGPIDLEAIEAKRRRALDLAEQRQLDGVASDNTGRHVMIVQRY